MTPRSQRCSAHKRTGVACGRWAILGGTVCPAHGGAAPQVKLAADQRIRDLLHPSISAVREIIVHGDTDATRLAAAKLGLELNGYKATVQVQAETEVTVRVIHEDQPIVVLEQGYRLNGDGRADDPSG